MPRLSGKEGQEGPEEMGGGLSENTSVLREGLSASRVLRILDTAESRLNQILDTEGADYLISVVVFIRGIRNRSKKEAPKGGEFPPAAGEGAGTSQAPIPKVIGEKKLKKNKLWDR